MSLQCRDLLSLFSMSSIKLVAGADGLDSEITWVQYLELPDSIEMLGGGELVFTAGNSFREDSDALCSAAMRMMEHSAAGIVICLGSGIRTIPAAFAEFCDRMAFPLFVVPSCESYIHVSREICTYILQDEKKTDEKERFLLELVHGVRLSGKRLQRLNAMGITSDKRWCLICIKIDYLEKGSLFSEASKNSLKQSRLSDDFLNRIKNTVETYWKNKDRQEILFSEEEKVFWLAEIQPEHSISDRLGETLYAVKVRVPGIQMKIGVSEEISEVRNLHFGYSHTMDAVRFSCQKSEKIAVTFYENMVAYRLFQSVSSIQVLERMASSTLKDLMMAENRELLDTLICYINCDFSAKRTAETLFLHQNTMHYRLRRIEGMLERSIKKSGDLFDIMLAVQIYNYIQNQ